MTAYFGWFRRRPADAEIAEAVEGIAVPMPIGRSERAGEEQSAALIAGPQAGLRFSAASICRLSQAVVQSRSAEPKCAT